MEPHKTDTFCILPWIHLLLCPDGGIKLCCVANGTLRDQDKAMNLHTHPLEAVWNSEHLRNVRLAMLRGKLPSDCIQCGELEARSLRSYRQECNARWLTRLGPSAFKEVRAATFADGGTSLPPCFYQLIPGNRCNLRCRMCFPVFSSEIARDEVHRQWVPYDADGGEMSGPPEPTGSPKTETGLPSIPWYDDTSWIRETLLGDAQNLEAIYFTGGEPLLQRPVEGMIDHLLNQGVAPRVRLEINTNATVLCEPMLDKLSRFKEVSFGLSLDAYGPYHEYIRFPARWKKLARNVARLARLPRDRFLISALPVLQVYNLLNITRLLEFLDEIGIPYHINVATKPWFLNVAILPQKARDLGAERLRTYAQSHPSQATRRELVSLADHLEKMPSECSHEALRAFMRFTNDLDASRGQDFSLLHGELKEILDQEGFPWSPERRFNRLGRDRRQWVAYVGRLSDDLASREEEIQRLRRENHKLLQDLRLSEQDRQERLEVIHKLVAQNQRLQEEHIQLIAGPFPALLKKRWEVKRALKKGGDAPDIPPPKGGTPPA